MKHGAAAAGPLGPLPTGMRTWRPGDEVPMLAAAVACLEGGEFEGVTRHDLEASFARLPADPGICAVAEVDGEIVGWVIPRHDGLTVASAHRRRGHGTRLVTAGRAIARRHGLTHLRLWGPRHLPGPVAFLERNGFRLRLVDVPDVPASRAGARPAAFVPGPHGRPVAGAGRRRRGVRGACERHVPRTPVPTRVRPRAHPARARAAGFDPSTILLLSPSAARHELIGFVRVDRYADDDGRPAGDIVPIGVRIGCRGRGLGRQLLRWGIADLRRRGAEDVFLSVEDANGGALRRYESEGFELHVEWPHRTIPVEGESPAHWPGASILRRRPRGLQRRPAGLSLSLQPPPKTADAPVVGVGEGLAGGSRTIEARGGLICCAGDASETNPITNAHQASK